MTRFVFFIPGLPQPPILSTLEFKERITIYKIATYTEPSKIRVMSRMKVFCDPLYSFTGKLQNNNNNNALLVIKAYTTPPPSELNCRRNFSRRKKNLKSTFFLNDTAIKKKNVFCGFPIYVCTSILK